MDAAAGWHVDLHDIYGSLSSVTQPLHYCSRTCALDLSCRNNGMCAQLLHWFPPGSLEIGRPGGGRTPAGRVCVCSDGGAGRAVVGRGNRGGGNYI
jgi:hypothetical protein